MSEKEMLSVDEVHEQFGAGRRLFRHETIYVDKPLLIAGVTFKACRVINPGGTWDSLMHPDSERCSFDGCVFTVTIEQAQMWRPNGWWVEMLNPEPPSDSDPTPDDSRG